ncbi:carboxypeptidase S [Favolaschia claudopus]|uniref:Carboxypeptidase S n=1 Tax=Favolaschia claudopus TaxID=2862362 RepID=A0AAW0E7G1_9AGAR
MMTKSDTLPTNASPSPPRRARWPLILTVVGLTAILRFSVFSTSSLSFGGCHFGASSTLADEQLSAGVCPQESPIAPKEHDALWNNLTSLHATPAFRKRAAGQLGNAVRIPTETFDGMRPVGEDQRWITRGPFVDHLRITYPLVHKNLELQRVNTYGLIYTWKGSDASLKPLLLMGHYDVVPVAPLSADQWTHPPYSGYFDGESIWGRGSSDDKSGVIGIMIAIESLLDQGFAPTRTVVLSFGFDEEAGGYHGAGYLGPALLERFGPDSFAMIVDEGAGFSEMYGATFASPGVAEKGSLNVDLEVQTPGGHSSVPPAHTSIGILSALIVELESNPPPATLGLATPGYAMASCLAAHAPALPRPLRRAILRAPKNEKTRKQAEELLFAEGMQGRLIKALVGTTQAVDIISGGVKSNALPEQAVATINHRISTESSVNETGTRDVDLLASFAASKFNLSVKAFGEVLSSLENAAGTLEFTAHNELEPAPITPSDEAPYALLAGTIRTVFKVARADKGKGTEGDVKEKEIIVSPGMMTGNTDTRFNWELSKHIFRYGHMYWEGSGLPAGIHTVNEHLSADAFVEMITFFTTLILNVDESREI